MPHGDEHLLRRGIDKVDPSAACAARYLAEHDQHQPRRRLRHPDRLCDRHYRSDVGLCRHPRHRQGRRGEAAEAVPRDVARHCQPTAIRPALKLDGRSRRTAASATSGARQKGWRLLETHRSRRHAQARASLRLRSPISDESRSLSGRPCTTRGMTPVGARSRLISVTPDFVAQRADGDRKEAGRPVLFPHCLSTSARMNSRSTRASVCPTQRSIQAQSAGRSWRAGSMDAEHLFS